MRVPICLQDQNYDSRVKRISLLGHGDSDLRKEVLQLRLVLLRRPNGVDVDLGHLDSSLKSRADEADGGIVRYLVQVVLDAAVHARTLK